MTLSLSAEKIGKTKDQCLRLYKASEVSLLDLTKLVGTLSSTIQAVLPARLQFRFLQQQQIVSLKQSQSYLTLVKQALFRQMHLKKAGGCMPRDQNRESVVQEGTGSTYQSAGTFSHKVCYFDTCQNVENVSHTYPGRQHDSLELFAENGKGKESRTNADLKGKLGVSSWAGDHDYSQTFTREHQLQGKLGISAAERFLRMETVPSNFQQNMANIGEETGNRPVYFKVITKVLSIPSICLDSQSTEKSRGGESAFSNNSNSNLANPKLVRRALTSFSEKPNHFATKGRLTKGSSKPATSSYPKSNNATNSVGCLRKRLTEEGISERASDLIVSSRREGTPSTYLSAWNKWVSWCEDLLESTRWSVLLLQVCSTIDHLSLNITLSGMFSW